MLDKIKSFFSKVGEGVSKASSVSKSLGLLIWSNIKMLVLVFGGLFGLIEFNKIKAYYLVKSGQNEIDKDKEKDQTLSEDEKANEQKANALEKHAKDLSNERSVIRDDWYKK